MYKSTKSPWMKTLSLFTLLEKSFDKLCAGIPEEAADH